MDVLKMAVVGVGVQGKLHAETLAGMPNVELVGVADLSDRNREWAEQTLGVRATSSIADLFPEIDAVSICMPDHLHEQITIEALEAGKRVLLEKPMAVTTESCDRILDALERPDDLMIGHILRFDPRVIRARELVQSGELGEIWHVKVWRCTSQAVGAGIWDRTSVAWFLGIHDIDLVRFVTGLEAEVVHASGRKVLSPSYDVVHATLDLSNGGLLSMENNWTLPHGRPSRADAGLRIIGERGSVEVSLSHNDLLHVDRDAAGGNYRDTYFWPSPSGEGAFNLKSELDAFVTSARTGGPTPVSGADGRAAVQVVEAIEAALDDAGR
ncbi:Gfo/Idh/MocA family protein [Agromyces silvae]|uniref:Gfo/Idh/MocA family protein n=1 Tax=Agromyces silvae TaxID=3388266 RepID=UPI00280A96F0|nr:Gfo/Idh/MocA family oxidoreductase [Agromyces protaetiae]